MQELIKDLYMLIYGYTALSGYVSHCDDFREVMEVMGIKMLSINALKRLLDEFENMIHHEEYYSQCLREGKSIKTDIDNCANCKYYKLKTSGLIVDEDCKSLCHKRKE